MASKKLTQMQWIASSPAFVASVDDAVHAFLSGLPAPDFNTTPNQKALWAVVASAPEGTASPAGSAWVVSGETLRRLRAHRFS